MRLLYVTQVPLDLAHGGARHVIAVCQELANLGVQVDLLAPGTLDIPGVRRLYPRLAVAPGTRMEADLAASVMQACLTNRPDVAYVRLSASSSAVCAALFARRVPVVAELNGNVHEEQSRRNTARWKINVTLRALRSIVRRCAHLVVPLDVTRQYAEQWLGANNTVVIENGAALDVAVPGDRLEARATLGLPTDTRYLGMVGTLAAELRLDLLAEATAASSTYTVLVAGDGVQRSAVEAMAARRSGAPVIFLGSVPHAHAIRAIQAADVCLNPRDGWLGMKSIELAAVGRRQVVFDTDGVERMHGLYPDLRALHVVKDRTASALRGAIEEAFEAEERLGPLPAPAIERARAHLGWDTTARQIHELLRPLVG